MIYGYAMAVVAGFLLTAIERWTGVPRLRGWCLIVLLGLWAIPRMLLLFGTNYIVAAAVLDISFSLVLFVLIAQSVILSSRWRQLGVLTKLALFSAGQVFFYLGAAGVWYDGTRIGVYLGFYMLVGLILTVARRVIPMFIENGSGRPVSVYNSRWLDVALICLFVPFLVMELALQSPRLVGVFALALFLGHAARLVGWYTNAIWCKPLLWSLYLSIVWIDLGFIFLAMSCIGWVSRFVALHAMAYGGIGLVTLSMMARVSLGHTNRSIHHPPAATTMLFVCIMAGAVIRVLLPWWLPGLYKTWIAVSQLLWMVGFAGYLVTYGKTLLVPNASAAYA
jgi:uncharacterized protein involved in response to NO